MRLSSIAGLSAFALFAPGFSGAGYTLVSPLQPESRSPSVVFLPYAERPSQARSFTGELVRFDTLELDVAPARPAPKLDERGFLSAVARIRSAIAAGDVYQVNHTLRARLAPVPGEALFAKLSQRGGPRFAAWVRLPDGTELVSASPELFFAAAGERISCEPMKGTARREERAVLEASTKDYAELAMITDLMRSDLTRVCAPRSVRVVNPRRFVQLPYAWQTVSDIEGRLAPDAGLTDILEALHPAGSITGAPKAAAAALISELEQTPRGAYCGTLGLVEPHRATFSVLIRTAERTPRGWCYGVGSGITWASDAAAELAEVRLKLGALA